MLTTRKLAKSIAGERAHEIIVFFIKEEFTKKIPSRK